MFVKHQDPLYIFLLLMFLSFFPIHAKEYLLQMYFSSNSNS